MLAQISSICSCTYFSLAPAVDPGVIEHIPAFSWLINNLLGNGVPTFVALDRDTSDYLGVEQVAFEFLPVPDMT